MGMQPFTSTIRTTEPCNFNFVMIKSIILYLLFLLLPACFYAQSYYGLLGGALYNNMHRTVDPPGVVPISQPYKPYTGIAAGATGGVKLNRLLGVSGTLSYQAFARNTPLGNSSQRYLSLGIAPEVYLSKNFRLLAGVLGGFALNESFPGVNKFHPMAQAGLSYTLGPVLLDVRGLYSLGSFWEENSTNVIKHYHRSIQISIGYLWHN